MSTDYDDLKIKEYNLWDLYLHEKQYPYIGRSYAWAKRKVDRVGNMSLLERNELFDIVIPNFEKTVINLFGASLVNFACFGNRTPQLHFHLIPRYQKGEVNFEGVTFKDPNPLGNYVAPHPDVKVGEVNIIKIKLKMRKELNK